MFFDEDVCALYIFSLLPHQFHPFRAPHELGRFGGPALLRLLVKVDVRLRAG